VITGDDRFLISARDDVLIGGCRQRADELVGVRVDRKDCLPAIDLGLPVIKNAVNIAFFGRGDRS